MTDQKKDFTVEAQNVYHFMVSEGAVRYDAKTVGKYLTVKDLADSIGFYIGNWTSIKEKMLEMGYNISFLPGKGHFIGADGEQAVNAYYCGRMARGWGRRTRAYLNAINKRPELLPTYNKVLEDRFGVHLGNIGQEEEE